MRAAEVFEDARCIGLPGMFDSTDYWVHQEAAAECAKCTAIEACARLLDEVQAAISPAMRAAGGGASGTWAGELIGTSEPKWAKCGRESGYYNHRRNGEDPCGDCWEAHSTAESARYQRRKKDAS